MKRRHRIRGGTLPGRFFPVAAGTAEKRAQKTGMNETLQKNWSSRACKCFCLIEAGKAGTIHGSLYHILPGA